MTALFCLVTSALAATDILLLGNSYTSFNQLHSVVSQVFEAGEIETIVTPLTSGGLTLANHADRAQDKTSPWFDALQTNGQDREWVILQDQSQVPSFPHDNSDFVASLAGAVTLNGFIDAADAQTLFFLTWGRRDGDSNNPETNPDFNTMTANLIAGYSAYIDATETDTRPTWIAPVGLAFADIHDEIIDAGETPSDKGSLFYQLYNSDGSHPSAWGSYLSAAVFYTTITGESAIGLALPDSIDSTTGARLQMAADQAVFGSVDIFDYPWEPPSAATTTTITTMTDTSVDPTQTGWEGVDEPTSSCACRSTGGTNRGTDGAGFWLVLAGALSLMRRRRQST